MTEEPDQREPHGEPSAQFPFEDYYRLYSALDRIYAQYARRHGESSNTLYVLDTLYRNAQGISQADISTCLVLPKQTVGSIMARLQERGLAELVPSATDGRSKLCLLTAAGRAYCKPIMDELDAIERRCAGKLGRERLEEMKRTVWAFVDLMEQEIQHGA